MKPFPIPVVTLGPGSQPVDEAPQYIAAPGTMATFQPPSLRLPSSEAAVAGARAIVAQLLESMERGGFAQGGAAPSLRLSLLEHAPDVVEAVNEMLGQGEVSVLVAADRPVRIQESAFAGIWRIHTLREDGGLAGNQVEVADIPEIVRSTLSRAEIAAPPPPTAAAGVMNAPAIVRELIDASSAFRPGSDTHVINLTLLPVTEEDVDYLESYLGGGPVAILSRGYGNCRITSTKLAHTWWVQYFNSMDQLILNTIEVDDVPVVALAAREDFEDSAVRLREWVATL